MSRFWESSGRCHSSHRLAVLAAAAVWLSGCSETQVAVHSVEESKKARPERPAPAAGHYKIGKPYQIQGTWYYPRIQYDYDETGIASWYGPGFDGKPTANGETYDQEALTAAHRTLPMPSMVRVTNLENGRSLRLKVNDRGPFARGRIIDVSRQAAELLGFQEAGTAKVRVELIEAESRRLAAAAQSRQDDDPAPLAVPTVAVAVVPLAPSASAPPPTPNDSAAIGGGSLRAAEPLADRGRLDFIADNAMPQPDGVVTIRSERADRLYVQAGSFMYFHNANRLRVRLTPLGRPSIAPTIVDGRHFFRVRFGPLASIEDADRLFSSLLSKGYNDARIVVE
ncbi:MAG: septal ring lytic transglycosylase RlpA family protein [Kiloniellales bacterium]|nr:septal ring lytic transglycosylase RlpA family protein [Kiloniellales bacterium]